MAGMSTPGVQDADSLATILACFDLGINFLDTAYAYGMAGESERLIARAVAGRRDKMVIATKGGIEWSADRKQIIDGGRPRCGGNARKVCGGWRPIASSFTICTPPIRECRSPNRPARFAA